MSSTIKKRGLWTEENLKLAIEAVETRHVTQRAAAEKYHIPRRTLRNHLKSGVKSKIIGKQTTLNKHQEDELCQRIKRFAEIGLPLTPKFIRKQAFQFCLRYDIPNNFNGKKEMAGPDWLRLFLKRNPLISKRKPQILNPARAQKLNKPIVRDHFQEVRAIYDELSILDHPERLYNMDEKGCRITVHHQNTVLAAKGSKRVHLIAPEHAENVTIAMCVNATGTTIPPMIIFKGQRNNPELAENLPAGTLVRMAKKGSMTIDLFVEFIQHLGRHKVPGKCLLIFDGAKSHMSYDAVQEAEKHDIVLYCLPSNTTHELQPLDKSINKSFEHYWDEEVLRILYNKPDTKLTKATFNKMFSNTWPKCMTHTNIVNGFKATGLFPFNPEAIPEEAYAPSVLTEIQFRPNKENENLLICQNQLTSDQNPTTQQTNKRSQFISQSNPFSALSLTQSVKISGLTYRPPLVDYSSSSTDVSEDEIDKSIRFPKTAYESANCVSPSILSGQDHGGELKNQYEDAAVPSCSGLQKPALNSDINFKTMIHCGGGNSDTSDSDTSNFFVRKPSAKKCSAIDLYSFSSDDDNTGYLINKGDTTPNKQFKHTKASNKDTNTGKSSTSDSEDDNISLIDIRKNNSSFHKLLPTPNYAKVKPEKQRKKAINYKGVKVTKNLFTENDEERNKKTLSKKKIQIVSKKSMKTTSNKIQQIKTKDDKLCNKDKKYKNKQSLKTEKKKLNKEVEEKKTSKKQNQEDKWYCYACLEEKFEDMRECRSCNKWYHELCVGLTKDDKDFICSYCY